MTTTTAHNLARALAIAERVYEAGGDVKPAYTRAAQALVDHLRATHPRAWARLYVDEEGVVWFHYRDTVSRDMAYDEVRMTITPDQLRLDLDDVLMDAGAPRRERAAVFTEAAGRS